MSYKIPISYNAIEIEKLSTVLKAYENKNHGLLVSDFEENLKVLTGAAHLVALNSGTSALHMALKVLGVGKDDLVIAPTFTYVASINPIIYLGAIPVLVDVDSNTWNLDPQQVQKAVSDLKSRGMRVKAMVIVHNYGVPAMLDELLKIAKTENIKVVEDAAEALGATFKGKQVGTWGDIGILSFNNNKTFTTYGGGAAITENKEWADKIRFFASQGRTKREEFTHEEVGYNYLMSPLSAAYGLSQINDFSRLLQVRIRVFEEYKSTLPLFKWQKEPTLGIASRWLTVVLFNNELEKEKALEQFEKASIERRLLWKPLHLQPIFKGYPNYVSGISEELYSRGICLPSGFNMTSILIENVTYVLKSCVFKEF